MAMLLLVSGYSSADEVYVRLDTRPGVVQEIMLGRTEQPRAAVILIPGGKGIVDLSSTGPRKKGNFLVRARDQFRRHGMMVAVMDAASSWKKRKKGLKGKRITAEHVQDIRAVVDYLRQQTDAPVWLVGTSRGSISAAMAAASLGGDSVQGIVLTASVSERIRNQHSVFDTALGEIRVPVLLVHHEQDACRASPGSGAERIRKALVGAPVTELLFFSGGREKAGKECRGHSQHGFYGIETKVVDKIAAWILADPQRAEFVASTASQSEL